ncbi:MAG: PKD domain-containing protein [Ginsengibacter sp.]
MNDPVKIKTDAKAGEKYSFDFGNGIVETESTSSIYQTYKEAKTYTLMVKVDGRCTDIQTLVVSERKPMIVQDFRPIIKIPDMAFVNEYLTFSDESPYSTTSREWYFEDNSEVDGRSKSVSHTFKTTGNKKIVLNAVINGKTESTTAYVFIQNRPVEESQGLNDKANTTHKKGNNAGGRIVLVQPAPPNEPIGTENTKNITPPENINHEETEVKKGADISDAQLGSLLMEVSEDKKSAADFNTYLCDNLNIPVRYNKKSYSFSEFCSVLKQIKKIIKITPYPSRNQNNCIFLIDIKIKEKVGPLGIGRKTR